MRHGGLAAAKSASRMNGTIGAGNTRLADLQRGSMRPVGGLSGRAARTPATTPRRWIARRMGRPVPQDAIRSRPGDSSLRLSVVAVGVRSRSQVGEQLGERLA